MANPFQFIACYYRVIFRIIACNQMKCNCFNSLRAVQQIIRIAFTTLSFINRVINMKSFLQYTPLFPPNYLPFPNHFPGSIGLKSSFISLFSIFILAGGVYSTAQLLNCSITLSSAFTKYRSKSRKVHGSWTSGSF